MEESGYITLTLAEYRELCKARFALELIAASANSYGYDDKLIKNVLDRLCIRTEPEAADAE